MTASTKRPTKPNAYSYIRMSTDVQLKGDSLRRQLELSRTYAAQHGLMLVEASDLHDIGVSAYRGANVATGALGRFLQAVRNGAIDKGSYLLVESLDRLSRQEIMSSLSMLMELINNGIHVVTLVDGRTYDAETTDLPNLMMSIIVLGRAHEESRTKSHRLSAAWANKRRNVSRFKLTSKCPAWLRLRHDRTAFDVIEERARIVKSIFEGSAAGVGAYSIASRLNASGVPPFGSSQGWQISYIRKILHSRAAVGEFQPHRFVDGISVPDGPPLTRYFPQVVSEDLFFRAQAASAHRRVGGGGRRGVHVSNLFSKIARCAYCGSRMHYIDKGPGPKGGTYLVCDSARRGLSCERTGWRYQEFEASFLAFVQELDLGPLLQSEAASARRIGLEQKFQALRGREAELTRQRERTYELILEERVTSAFIREKLEACERDLATVARSVREVSAELANHQNDVSRFYESKDQIKSLIARLQERNSDEVYKLRSQIASKLRSLVAELVVAPVGQAPITRQTLATLRDEGETYRATDPVYSDHLGTTISQLQSELESERADQRYFAVTFKDGSMRAIRPNRRDPLQFEHQVYTTASDVRRIEADGRDQLLHHHHDRIEFSPDALVQLGLTGPITSNPSVDPGSREDRRVVPSVVVEAKTRSS